MEMVHNKKDREFSVPAILFAGAILFLTLFLALGRPGSLFAQDAIDTGGEESGGNVINLYDAVVGSVDAQGNVTNKFGKVIGSVNSDGSILNVSGIDIGKVTAEGEVLNQAGTVLGSVDKEGSVYNVSGRRIGQVKEVEEINLMGGAARLLFLK